MAFIDLKTIKMISIKFSAAPEDFAVVQRHLATRVRRTHIDKIWLDSLYLTGYAFGLFGVIDTVLRLMELRAFSWLVLRAPQVTLSIGFLLLVAWSYARQAAVRRTLARQRRTRAVQTAIHASSDEISIRLQERSTTYRWRAIGEIESIRGFTLLYTKVDAAEFIPDGAFEGEEARRCFVQAARQWRSDAFASNDSDRP